MKKTAIVLGTLVATLSLLVSSQLSAAALRPTKPCSWTNSCPAPTTTTTPLPAPRPAYTQDNPMVIGCSGFAPYQLPVENWVYIYDVQNGDWVNLCGNILQYKGDTATSTPGNCLAATLDTSLNEGWTYSQRQRFTVTADSEFQGDTQRLRMRVFDAYGTLVQTQNRWEENNDWGKAKANLSLPFRFKKVLPSGTYKVEVTAWFYEKADGCGPTKHAEAIVIALG